MNYESQIKRGSLSTHQEKNDFPSVNKLPALMQNSSDIYLQQNRGYKQNQNKMHSDQKKKHLNEQLKKWGEDDDGGVDDLLNQANSLITKSNRRKVNRKFNSNQELPVTQQQTNDSYSFGQKQNSYRNMEIHPVLSNIENQGQNSVSKELKQQLFSERIKSHRHFTSVIQNEKINNTESDLLSNQYSSIGSRVETESNLLYNNNQKTQRKNVARKFFLDPQSQKQSKQQPQSINSPIAQHRQLVDSIQKVQPEQEYLVQNQQQNFSNIQLFKVKKVNKNRQYKSQIPMNFEEKSNDSSPNQNNNNSKNNSKNNNNILFSSEKKQPGLVKSCLKLPAKFKEISAKKRVYFQKNIEICDPKIGVKQIETLKKVDSGSNTEIRRRSFYNIGLLRNQKEN